MATPKKGPSSSSPPPSGDEGNNNKADDVESPSSPSSSSSSPSPCGDCVYCGGGVGVGFDTRSTMSDVSSTTTSSTTKNNSNNNNNNNATTTTIGDATGGASAIAIAATTTTVAPVQAERDGAYDEHLQQQRQQEQTTTSGSNNDNDNDENENANANNNSSSTAACWSEGSIRRTADLWKLSSKEVDELRELGMQLMDVHHRKNAPEHVVRFYKARPNCLKSAECMFRNMVTWRIQNNVDTILQDYRPPQQLLDYYPGAILQGLDNDGDPVYLSRIGSTDGSGLIKRFGHDEMVRQAIWIRENASEGSWIQEYEQKYGKPVCQITIIEDVQGLGYGHLYPPLLSLYKEAMRIDQDYYPEMAKRMIVVRTPSVFRMIWNIGKHFFDPGVRSKMVFSGVHNFREVLRNHVDLSILPPCVLPGIGSGAAAPGMPSRFEGGPLPPLPPPPESSSSSSSSSPSKISDPTGNGSTTTNNNKTPAAAAAQQRKSLLPTTPSLPEEEQQQQERKSRRHHHHTRHRRRFPTAETDATASSCSNSNSPCNGAKSPVTASSCSNNNSPCNGAKSIYTGDFPFPASAATASGGSNKNNKNDDEDNNNNKKDNDLVRGSRSCSKDGSSRSAAAVGTTTTTSCSKPKQRKKGWLRNMRRRRSKAAGGGGL